MRRYSGQTFLLILMVLELCLCSAVHAASFTAAQLTALKNDIAADGTISGLPHTSDNADLIAGLYNQAASPDFWVWRTVVPVQEIVETTTADSTTWSWTTFIGRSQGERDAWRDMTARGSLNASLVNTRQGLADIFSGAGGATQCTHLLTVARRKATRAEKLFATGTGSTGSPATMGFEGQLRYPDVENAWAQP